MRDGTGAVPDNDDDVGTTPCGCPSGAMPSLRFGFYIIGRIIFIRFPVQRVVLNVFTDIMQG